MKNVDSRLTAIERTLNSFQRGNLTITFTDGSAATVSAGRAIELARERSDISRVTDHSNGGNGMLSQLIEGLYTN